MIEKRKDARDGRKTHYELTQKGIDLAPVLTEMVLWAAEHEDTQNPVLVKRMKNDRRGFEARIREEWKRRSKEAKR